MPKIAFSDCKNQLIAKYGRRETVQSFGLCPSPACLRSRAQGKTSQSVWQTLWQTSPSTDG